MADAKISALPASTTPLAGTEVLPIVQSSTTKKVTVANLTEGRTVKAGNLEVAGYGIFSDALNMLGGKPFYFYNPANNNYWAVSSDSSNNFLLKNVTNTVLSGDTSGNITFGFGNVVIGTAGKGIDASIGYVNSGSYQVASGAIITESGTTRTLSASDNGKVIYCTSGSAVTITTAVSLGAGFSCTIIQGGAGQITVAQGASTTLASYSAFYKSAGQYAALTLICPVANTFILAGNTAP